MSDASPAAVARSWARRSAACASIVLSGPGQGRPEPVERLGLESSRPRFPGDGDGFGGDVGGSVVLTVKVEPARLGEQDRRRSQRVGPVFGVTEGVEDRALCLPVADPVEHALDRQQDVDTEA